jgi:S-adenosylmethionine:tRNA ribosyltransferase-isomerase
MLISDFDFDLPETLIAQSAPEKRDASRMLIVDRRTSSYSDGQFAALPDILIDGDVLILNNTKVFPARLIGRTETGANVEVFLVNDLGDDRWDVLARPAKRLSNGKVIHFDARLTATSIERLPDGMVRLQFRSDGEFFDILSEIGLTPLPPYIKRGGGDSTDDRQRYQTVYAKNRGAIAAPTAGLHFTPEMLDALRDMGVTVAEITLHVGYGTFEPVRVDELSDHRVLPERYEIDEQTARTLNNARAHGRRFVAVGTTTTRAIEANIAEFGQFTAGKRLADLTITPGHEFRAVDALLTNFHLPKSSLLVLTSTFGGHELIMKAYQHAVETRYHFYSYGDCMLIV